MIDLVSRKLLTDPLTREELAAFSVMQLEELANQLLKELRACEAQAAVRKQSRMQMQSELASIGLQAGHQVVFEELRHRGARPASSS